MCGRCMPEFLLIFVSERKNIHRISYSVNIFCIAKHRFEQQFEEFLMRQKPISNRFSA